MHPQSWRKTEAPGRVIYALGPSRAVGWAAAVVFLGGLLLAPSTPWGPGLALAAVAVAAAVEWRAEYLEISRADGSFAVRQGGRQRFAGGRLRDIGVVDGELTLTNADGQQRAIGRGLRADLLGWIAGDVRDVLRFDANGDDDASLA